MLSKNFFYMAITVAAAVAIYYLLAAKTTLSENISIGAGVLVAIVCSVLFKRLGKDSKKDC